MVTLQPASLNWALAHAQQYGDTDIFPPAIEIAAISHDWARLRPILEKIDLTTWPTRPSRRCLAPKGRLGFRIATQLDPLDFLLYAAAVYEIGSDIEAARVARRENVVFSYRFAPRPDGRIFDPRVNYRTFTDQSRHRCGGPLVTHVAVTDIADFYSKIYHHPLENALALAAPGKPHVTALTRFLSNWSSRVSHGIPIGNAPSRLLAELAISDVDQSLLGAQIDFVRYNDDYRIFTQSREEAYRHLAYLANALYENHGLTLQPKKTYILETNVFVERYLRMPSERELAGLQERFRQLLDDLGIEDPYDEIEYKQLSRDQKARVNQLNLVAMFRDELTQGDEPDAMVLRFILRRMAQLNRPDLINDCVDNIEGIYPVLPDVVRYLLRLRGLSSTDRRSVGKRMIDLLESSIVSELEYYRLWILHLFASSPAWNCSEEFISLLGKLADSFSRRELILALGRANARSWFGTQRRSLFEEGPWAKRAFLAAASCLPPDARDHWYRSIEPRLDDVERAVVNWARVNPFP